MYADFLVAVMGLAHVESAGTLTEAKALGSEVLSVASWKGKGRQCLRKNQIGAPVNWEHSDTCWLTVLT